MGIFICFLTFSANAQVNIGDLSEPNKHAILELKPSGDYKGLLMPKVTLTDRDSHQPFASNDIPKGMLVYNIYDNGTELPEGLYSWNGSRWEFVGSEWFYMPAAPFETDYTTTPEDNQKDLYAVYAQQFSLAIGSSGAPTLDTRIPQFGRTDFYYYVISYDDTVFSNIRIDEDGVMTYDLLKDGNDATYINIIFVRKN
jgi:hypothetical protein